MEEGKSIGVVIPEELFQIFEFEDQDLPGIASVNFTLKRFEPKQVFAWHCAVTVECEEAGANGMPSEAEAEVLNRLEDLLDDKIKGNDKSRPNALFLARVTWNGTRELIWRVYDPEQANAVLEEIIEDGAHDRDFAYTLDPDQEWEMTELYLDVVP